MSDRQKFPRYMMATEAWSGGIEPMNISRDEPDLCIVRRDDGDSYRGYWSQGFGFVNVRFPKATTHELTEADIAVYSKLTLVGPQGQRWPALAPLTDEDAP